MEHRMPHYGWEPSIFEYLDYRAFLQDYYDHAKVHLPAFSYRYFSRRAGYSAPNFLKLVTDGKRNLTEDSTARFAKALNLDARETDFFELLVHFNQASNDEERNHYFERVAASRRFRSARKIDNAFYQYTAHWYYPAIREMAARPDFRDDPHWIAAELVPPIKASEAKRALSILFDLGLLERDEAGQVHRGEASITTGPTVRSLTAANYHRQMIARAHDAVEAVPGTKRELGALTVCISPNTLSEIKQTIRDTRKRLLVLCDADPEPHTVYQINFQVFPLSRFDEEPSS